MTLLTDLRSLGKEPQQFLAERLTTPTALAVLIVATVAPLMAVRAASVLLRSLLAGAPVAGIVLGMSNLALQAGAWIGLLLLLPAVARQFGATLEARHAQVLATYASVPLWLAGALYLVPEEPTFLWVLSRSLVAAAATFGLYVLNLGLHTLNVPSRQFIVAATAGAYVILYFLLFALLGLSSSVMLFLLGAAR